MIILLFGPGRITSGLLRDSTLMASALHYRRVLSTFAQTIKDRDLGYFEREFLNQRN